jgi:hypothetical protein
MAENLSRILLVIYSQQQQRANHTAPLSLYLQSDVVAEPAAAESYAFSADINQLLSLSK